MVCTYCGTELPPGALFCGECGRAVTAQAKRVARVQVPTVIPATRVGEGVADLDDAADHGPNWHWGDSGASRCDHCGAQMAADEIFCPDCGAVSQAAVDKLGSRETAIIEPVEPLTAEPPRADVSLVVEEDAIDEPEPYTEPELEPELEPEPEPESVAHSTPAQLVEPERYERPASLAPPAAAPPAAPAATLAAEVPFGDPDELEATRILGRAVGERFVLQFSTGESSTVSGSGLIGRNPIPEPGEFFDQLVRVIDPSRSVSKTHLEFGQEDSAFWVMDRYSGNGTVLREPDSRPIRCQPERRYRVVRGTRVEIGEQFFIVS